MKDSQVSSTKFYFHCCWTCDILQQSSNIALITSWETITSSAWATFTEKSKGRIRELGRNRENKALDIEIDSDFWAHTKNAEIWA